MVKVSVNQNKITIEFDSKDDALLFYAVLKSYNKVKWEYIDLNEIIITDVDIKRFPDFLRKKPKRRITSDETIKDLLSYLTKFRECSESKITPETLIKCIKNKHYSSALRNYLYMKYYYNEIPREIYTSLIEKIPDYSSKRGISRDRVPLSWVIQSIDKAKSIKYYHLYIALYYTGGARLQQLLGSLKNKPIIINKEYLKIPTSYTGTKSSIYHYMPINLYYEIIKLKINAKPKSIARRFSLLGLVPTSLIRSFSWQTSKQILGEPLALLLQGRIGELSKYVTYRSYDDLIYQLDKTYPKWKEFIDEIVAVSTSDKTTAKKRAQEIISRYELLIPP